MKKIVVGVIILFVGIFLLLYNLGFVPYSLYHLVISWRALLVGAGMIMLFDKKSDTKKAGIVLILVGVAFLLPDIFDLSLKGIILPLLIIIAGIYFIIRAVLRRGQENTSFGNRRYEDFAQKTFVETSLNQEGFIHREFVFSGSKERLTAGKIKGADISAVFSGVELDFTQMELSEEVKTVYIKIQSVFSGVVVFVPDEWNLIIQKTGVFGGFADKRSPAVREIGSGRTVILDLEAVFGGGEIKTYE